MIRKERVHPFIAVWIFVSAMGGVGLFQALLTACPPALTGWGRERALALVAGNMTVGLAVGLLAVLLPTLFRRRPWTRGSAFLAGLLLAGLEPLSTSLFDAGLLQRPQDLSWAGLPLLFAAAVLGKRWQPKRLPLAALLASLTGVGAWHFHAPAREAAPPSLPSITDSTLLVSPEHPDVILISFDTLRADAVLGQGRAAVPTWDRLRKAGSWAPWAWSSSNQTIPGHWGMFTGLETQRHGVPNNAYRVPNGIPVLAQRFQKAGWRTLGCVSNRLLRIGEGFEAGFEMYDDRPSALHQPLKTLASRTWIGWITNQKLLNHLLQPLVGEDRMGQAKQADVGMGKTTLAGVKSLLEQALHQPQPAFVFLHFMDAHAPYRAPAPYAQRRTTALPSDPTKFERKRAAYWEEVDFLDDCLRQILAQLETSDRPFVLMLTGDHGEFLGEHNLLGHSNHMYRDVVQVPFLFVGSRIPAQTLEPVHLADVAPTLLARAGIPWQEGEFDGRNLLGKVPSDPARFRVSRDDHFAAVVQGHWKWIGNWDEEPEPDLWFHLGEDPAELNPLPAAYVPDSFRHAVAGIVSQLQAGTTATLDESSARREALQALGYLDAAEDS